MAISLKASLGVKHDFCLFFEDSAGNLISISDDAWPENENFQGIGNGEFQIGKNLSSDPIYCGS